MTGKETPTKAETKDIDTDDLAASEEAAKTAEDLYAEINKAEEESLARISEQGHT